MSYWSKLSMKDKADVMKLFLDKGISDLDTIRREYNTFAGGGSVVTSDLLDRVTQEEGFEPHPVDIGDGKMTLGSGLTSKEWRDLYEKRGRKWSQEDNRRAVQTELMRREQWAEKNVPNWNILPDSSKKALLSYKYNYDFTKTNSPKLFQALEAGNFREAAKQMDATSKNPKFKRGLTDRRKREQEWFLSDIIGSETPAATSPTPVQTPTTIGITMPSITEPAVSTAVRNNYVPATTTPYNRGNNMRRAFESTVAFNRMMNATSLQNNPLPEYQFPIEYANGGKIHIKPSHRGRLTELKKRTGKSEAELYKTGGPAVRKMITFARNARKWKHGLGGNLFDGITEDSQQMVNPYRPNGGFYYVNSEGQPVNPTTRDIIELPDVVVAADKNSPSWYNRTTVGGFNENGFHESWEGIQPLVMSSSEWNRSHSANDLQTMDPYGEIPWNAASIATGFIAPELAYSHIAKGAQLPFKIAEEVANNGGFAVSTPRIGKIFGKDVGQFTGWVPFDRPWTEGLSWVNTGAPTAEGLPIQYITSKHSGEARKLYDAIINKAIREGHPGVISGKELISAPKTYSTLEHYYPDRVKIDDMGHWSNDSMTGLFSGPKINTYTVEDFLKTAAEHSTERVHFLGAPRYRLEKPSTLLELDRGYHK